MLRQRRTPRASLRAQCLVWCCALSLLALQGLGLWHRMVHVPAQTLQAATLATLATESLGHKIGSADCQLVDQFTQFDLLCASVAPSLVVDAPAGMVALAPAARPLQRHWSRAARGPPVQA